MPIEIEIPDSDLLGFTEHAQERLREEALDYATDLVEEANRVEAGQNPTDGPPEITTSMVNDAEVLMRRGYDESGNATRVKILRVSASVLSLISGVMYNPSSLQNSGYMLLFILVVASAIILVTLSVLYD